MKHLDERRHDRNTDKTKPELAYCRVAGRIRGRDKNGVQIVQDARRLHRVHEEGRRTGEGRDVRTWAAAVAAARVVARVDAEVDNPEDLPLNSARTDAYWCTAVECEFELVGVTRQAAAT